MKKRLFYFGCIGQAGHYFFAPGEKHLWGRPSDQSYFADLFPGLNRRVIELMDGSYCPGDAGQAQGVYRESTIPPLRIIAWWDRTGPDTRMGCNSVLFGAGYVDGEEMLDDAVTMFPSVMERQARPKPECPVPELKDSYPVVLYFANKQEADEFVDLVQAEKKMKARQL